MKELTDEEADALDEYYTNNIPDIELIKSRGMTEKSTVEIINELIEEKIAAEGLGEQVGAT